MAIDSASMPANITDPDAAVNTLRVRPASQPVNNGAMDFPARLKQLRQRAGLTQEQLAEKCGWSGQSQVSNYEKGRGDPPFSELPCLAIALGVDVPELFEDPDSPLKRGSHFGRIDPTMLASSIEALRRVAEQLEVPYDPVTHPAATAAAYELSAALGAAPSQAQVVDFGAQLGALMSRGSGDKWTRSS
jgi:DNA-binding XRE family transcriptional regulator